MVKPLSVQDITTNAEYTFELVECSMLTSSKEVPKGNGRIYLQNNGSLTYIAGEKSCFFRIEDRNYAAPIMDFLTRGFANLACTLEMQEKSSPQKFFLYIVFFSEETPLRQINVILSQNAQKQLKDKNYNNIDYLKKEMLLNDGLTDSKYFAYSGNLELTKEETENTADLADKQKESSQSDNTSKTIKEKASNEETVKSSDVTITESKDLDKEPSMDNVSAVANNDSYGKLVGKLRIYAKSFILLIGVYSQEESDLSGVEETLFVAEKFIFSKIKTPCMKLGIASDIEIVTSQQRSANAVKKIFDTNDKTYLSIWGKYAEAEGTFLIYKAREIAKMTYSQSINKDKDNNIPVYVLSYKENLKYLKTGDILYSATEPPIYITKNNVSWDEYNSYAKQQRNIKKKALAEKRKITKQVEEGDAQDNNWSQESGSTDEFRYKITNIKLGEGEITLQIIDSVDTPKQLGKLYWDDFGYRIQIERRERARENIKSGYSANPRLGALIGAGEAAAAIPERGGQFYHEYIEPFSSSIIDGMEYKPTDTQRRAVEIALNTPDIAIIQGPPGTGKTTVITAILKRLNEVLGKNGAQTGEVLVTSLQHDAVRNVIQRVKINSLPVIKFGGRASEESDQDSIVSDWCSDLENKIREKNPQLKETEEQRDLSQIFSFYVADPSNANARAFLKKAEALVTDISLLEEIRELQDKYKILTENYNDKSLFASIRRLWSTPKAFKDGGSFNAAVLLSRLEEGFLNDRSPDKQFIIKVLSKAAAWEREQDGIDIDKEMRADLKKCQDLLLRMCINKPRYQLAKLDDEIISLYREIKERLIKPESETDNILYSLLNQLQYNQPGIKEALKKYMFAYAATAQQSDSDTIYMSKDVNRKENEFPEYDTVIVDEAARVNPGDLMIPLSQAKRRIILVGDHRQLPHMYDQEIFDEMVDEGVEFDATDIEHSMFEHLLGTVKKLEEKDGMPRFITLDAQYRMHPLLGKFVSDNFYARHDKNEAFGSPISADKFVQPFYDKPLLWINVPSKGKDLHKEHGSWVRRIEGEIIVKRIRQMVEHMPPGKPLSIGVISFYRGQVNYIKGLIASDEVLSENKIVNVGTVDSYQGMEYDIIFLSVVRSQLFKDNIDWLTVGMTEQERRDAKTPAQLQRKKEFDRIGRKYYGFLTSENRLCVALSRQRRLLIVVGEGALFHGDVGSRLAEAYVPALKNFYELCKDEEAIEEGASENE